MSKTSLALIFSVSLLFAMGLVMVFNTTSGEALEKSFEATTHLPFLKQLLYGAVGMVLGLLFYAVGYQKLLDKAPWLFWTVTLLLALVFISGVGLHINGARRWIRVGGVAFQPSEFAKLAIPLFFIYQVTKSQIGSMKEFLKKISLLFIPIFLIFIEPDNGTTGIILVTLCVLFTLSKVRLLYWALPLLCLVSVGVVAAMQMPHVPDRIRVYLNPELDLRGKGHQPYQAKIAAGSGKLFGKGPGGSLQKLNYLPEARSDYIAAIYAEEYGFLGMVGMIALYMTIAFAGFSIAFKAKEKRAFYLAAIFTFLIVFQAFLNLGIVSGLLPSKGTTLPFVSQGGSSLITNLISFFILLDLSKKQNSKEKKWKRKYAF